MSANPPKDEDKKSLSPSVAMLLQPFLSSSCSRHHMISKRRCQSKNKRQSYEKLKYISSYDRPSVSISLSQFCIAGKQQKAYLVETEKDRRELSFPSCLSFILKWRICSSICFHFSMIANPQTHLQLGCSIS